MTEPSRSFSSIPTVYRGVQYRSRLEARWACFFDLMGWPFQYEPFDLAGWIPDFLLAGHQPVLVEVKPVDRFPEEVAKRIDRACPFSGDLQSQEVLIVGCIVPLPADDQDAGLWDSPPVRFGWLRDYQGWDPREGRAVFGQWRGSSRLGFCHETGVFTDRISGCYDGGSYGGLTFSNEWVIEQWHEAGNTVQWRGPKSRVIW